MFGSNNIPSEGREEEEEISRPSMRNVCQRVGRNSISLCYIDCHILRGRHVSVAVLVSFGMWFFFSPCLYTHLPFPLPE